jgi:hypothetical protein
MNRLIAIILLFSSCAANEAGIRRQAEWQANNCLALPQAQFYYGHKACEREAMEFCQRNGLDKACATGLWVGRP